MTIALLLSLSIALQEAEAKVRDAIATLEKALVANDGSVEDQLDLQGLLREMERRGSIPDSGFRVRGVRRLEENLTTLAASPGALNGGWKRIVPLTVRVAAAGDEADAFCRVTIGERKQSFRLWLSRVDGAWKLSDLENLDGTYRLSVIGLQYSPGVRDDDDRQALRDGVMALQRGAVALGKGQHEAARDALAMARRCSPPEYVLDWIDLLDGLAHNGMGDLLLALKAADRVLSRQKDLAVALRLKMTCHAELREHAKAVAAGMEYLKLVGDDAEMWTFVGESYERLGKADEAIEAYRKGAAADPEDPCSRKALGELLVERGRAKEAAPWFSAASRLAPPEEKAFENASDLLDRAGAHAEALALADEAVALRPDDASVLARRGRALRTVGRLKEAEELLRRASRLHPDDAEIPQELVLALAQSGKDAEAQALTAKVGEYVRAFVHAAAGRPERSLEELAVLFRTERALAWTVAWVEKEPVFDKIRGDKIVTAARATRDYRKASDNPYLAPEVMLRIAQARTAAVPEDGPAWVDQGRILRLLRRPAEAEPVLRKAIEKSKDKAPAQDELARALAAQGKLEEALAVAEESGRELGVALHAIAGKREAAIKALQKALEEKPDRHAAIVSGDELDEFRRLTAVQDLLRKARAKLRK
jgi:tetratricopeptide (TPR) repeat protein